MVSVRTTRYESGYKLWLEFESGESGTVDLSDVIRKFKTAAPLVDLDEFKKFYLDEWPTLAWPCGFDISPESLYERVTGKRQVWMDEQGVR
jgi:hypothetical protein